MHISSINVNNLSCITHQLNTIKCITKQYHEMAIEYLSFICFMGGLYLDHSYLSSSSFMKSSFLIQMIRWIRGSSRIEFFIFLIAWGIFFEWWELDLLPYSSSLLISRAESNHLLLVYILHMNESHDPGRPFNVAITTSTYFFFYHFKLFCILDLHILQLFSQIHLLNYVLIFK